MDSEVSAGSLKEHRTRVYRWLALFYLFFPLTFLPVVVFLIDVPMGKAALLALQTSFLAVSALAVITGYGLYEVRRWAWYLLHLTEVLVLAVAANFTFRHGQSHYPVVAFLVVALLVWLGHRRISRELRVPYFMPQIAWWESNPRYKTQIPAQVVRNGGRTLEADIMDLSVAGAFIKCRPEFELNELIEIRTQLFGREWRTRGTVVWNTFGAVTHPRGIGVKFGALDRTARRVLKAATMRLQKIVELNRTGRYWLSSDEYNKVMAKLKAPLPRGEV